MSTLVDQLTARFMPMLTHMAEQLARDFPGMAVNTYSDPVGNNTNWQGHDWGIDMVFPDVPDGSDDNTWLSVEVGHLTTAPVINASRGLPNCEQVFPEWQDADADTIEQVQRELPRLFEGLRQSLFEVGPSLNIMQAKVISGNTDS